MLNEMMKKAADEMKKDLDIRLNGFEAKIDDIGNDIAEIKSMLQKLQ